MMKRISMYSLLCILLLFFAFVGGCGGTDENSESGSDGVSETVDVSEPDEQEIAGLVNGFDTIDDLYSIKFNVGTDYPADYKGEINADKNYIKDGKGSLKIIYRSGDHPEPIIYCSNIRNLNLSDLKSVSCWVYNDTAYSFAVKFNLLRKNNTSKKSAMFTQEYTVKSREWTLLELPINNIVMQYNGDNVLGFGVEFVCRVPTPGTDEPQTPFTFYLDTFVLKYGAELTAEDKEYKTKIDNVIDAIDKLPNGISESDEAQIREIYDMYATLPDIYKGAVKNYSRYENAVSKLMSELYKNKKTDESSPVLFTDRFFGVNHFSLASTYSTTAKVEYSESVKYGAEQGSTAFVFDGKSASPWAAWNFTTSAPLSSYDYISFYVKNETDNDVIMFYTWSNNRTIPMGDWVKVEIPVSAFGINFNELEITGVGQTTLTGKLYFSAINCYSSGIDGLFENAVTSYEAEDGAQSETSGVTTFTSAADGMTIKLNKTRTDFHGVINAYANIYVDKYYAMKVLNAAGQEEYTISLNKGWNTVAFRSNRYNFDKTESLRFDTTAGETIKIKEFIIGLSMRDAVLNAYMLHSWCPSGALTKEELQSAADFLESYYALTDSEKKFLKGSVDSIETDVGNVTSNFETALKSLIDSLNETFVYSDATILNNVYDSYTKIKELEFLSAEYVSKAEAIIRKWSDLPNQPLDFEKSEDREIISIKNVSNGESDPYTTMHDDDPSYNVLSAYLDSEYGYVVELKNPTYSGVGVKFNFHTVSEANERLKSVINGYDYVVFYVFNPLSDAYSVTARISNYNWGLTYLAAQKLESGWNMLSVKVSDFAAAMEDSSYLYVYVKKNGVDDSGYLRYFANGTTETLKISSFYLYKDGAYQTFIKDYEDKKQQAEQKKIDEVIEKINALPAIGGLKSKSSEIDNELLSIQSAYEVYGDKITNWSDFLDYKAEYDDLPYIVLDAESESSFISAAKRHENDIAADCYDRTMQFTVQSTEDAVYGDVFEITNANHDGAFLRINFHSGLSDARGYWSKKLDNVKGVYFYVYNPLGTDIVARIMQGDWVVLNAGTENECRYTLKPGWNVISLSKNAFLDSTNIDNRDTAKYGDNGNIVKSDCGYYLMILDEGKKLSVNGNNLKISSFYGLEDGKTVPQEPNIERYNVTFDSDGGSSVETQQVVKGGLIQEPKTPVKASGAANRVIVFDGWYYGDKKWNFATDKVESDVTLKARWKIIEYSEPLPID